MQQHNKDAKTGTRAEARRAGTQPSHQGGADIARAHGKQPGSTGSAVQDAIEDLDPSHSEDPAARHPAQGVRF